MPDAPEGLGADAHGWLEVVRGAVAAIRAGIAELTPAQRAEPLGRGAGGDRTLRVDRVAEDAIIAALEASGRPLTLVSEEIGERAIAGGGPPVVVVDPIDGSLNASRGLPGYATSVAVAAGPSVGDVWLGVVADLCTGEELVAERGRGAWLDGRALPLRRPDGRLEILLVEGASPTRIGRAAAVVDGRVRRIRAVGSLALALCAVATGRGDAMVGLGRGRSVDVAAAQLIAREAGALVGLPAPADLAGAPLDVVTRRNVMAARSEEHLALLRSTLGAWARPTA